MVVALIALIALIAVLLLLDPTAFGKLNRKRNGALGQNIRLSICQDRLGVGGVGVEHENSVIGLRSLFK